MGKVAFVFPGQGAQYSGMGRELAECSPAARRIFEQADAIRPETSRQCFSGSEEELKQTVNTQPCLFAVELAAAAALEEAGVKADQAAGFSLGELAAMTWAGGFAFDDGFRSVCRRAELMQNDAEAAETFMAAVVKLPSEAVEAVCAGFEGVYPVNYNCPGQVTVAGKKEVQAEFSAAVRAAGGRALPLKVGGGFHSPFMARAAAGFGDHLSQVALREPRMTVYSNCTGEAYTGNYRELLTKQICSPVRWETIVRNMIAGGVDTFIEVGPGNVLCGLIGRIDPDVRCFAVGDRESLEKCVAEVAKC